MNRRRFLKAVALLATVPSAIMALEANKPKVYCTEGIKSKITTHRWPMPTWTCEDFMTYLDRLSSWHENDKALLAHKMEMECLWFGWREA